MLTRMKAVLPSKLVLDYSALTPQQQAGYDRRIELPRLRHVTGLFQLAEILKSRRFLSPDDNRLSADSGMSLLGPGSGTQNDYRGRGAVLYLQWLGPRLRRKTWDPSPFLPNILYEMPGWKYLIGYDSSPLNYRFVGFELHKRALDEACNTGLWLQYLPQGLARRVRHVRRVAMRRRFRTWWQELQRRQSPVYIVAS